MKIWAKTKEFCEGKFLVIRRDGTIPAWPHFVLGARDPAAPYALRAYVDKARDLSMDEAYCVSIEELAQDFELFRTKHGDGDPDSGPHRKDDAGVIALMRWGGLVTSEGCYEQDSGSDGAFLLTAVPGACHG